MKLVDINKAVVVWGPISQEGLKILKKEGHLVVVAENRPSLLGLYHNLPLLKEADIETVYCTDNTLGFLFDKGKVFKTYLFYRDKSQEGLIGMCGSLYIVLLSKLHKIPLTTMVAGKVRIENSDKSAATLRGKDFVLEENTQDYIIEADDELVEWEVLA
ncbi:MAG: hypothetical protein JSW40_06205 [Candidatus Omnitrophota bacterium]|nr:MAG: hypothetical protein JSW40_06205 [Candidatus Omnitrophota bacterium]